MKKINTFEAKIYIGLRKGYEAVIHSLEEIEKICQSFCNEKGWCVTVQKLNFIYKNGNEPGCVIGIINYPRFPMDELAIKKRVLELAEILLHKMEQNRLSVVYPDETVMIEK